MQQYGIEWHGKAGNMKKIFRKIYIWFRIQMRILRLLFLRVQKPADAKTPEEMLEEIKKKLKLT